MYRVYKIFELGVCENEEIALPDGRTAIVEGAIKNPVTQVRDTSLTLTDIRAAIRATGYPLKKGQSVYCDEIDRIKKYMDDEKFFELAETVEE